MRLGEDRAVIPGKVKEGGTALTRLNADVWGSGSPTPWGGRPGDGPRSRAPCPPPHGAAPARLLHPASHISPEPAAATQTGSLLEAGGSTGRDPTECVMVSHGRLCCSARADTPVPDTARIPEPRGKTGGPGCPLSWMRPEGPAWNRASDMEGPLHAGMGPGWKEAGAALSSAAPLRPSTGLHVSPGPRPAPRGTADEDP